MKCLSAARLLLGCLLVVLTASSARAETIARCGEGWLEEIDGYRVLHLKGSPYEMGYQHGALLRESVRGNFHNVLVTKGTASVDIGPLTIKPRWLMDVVATAQRPYVPAKYFEEMEGLAAAADMPVQDILAANFLPELFHCSGFAIANSATKDGTLYHGRVLDYAIDWKLQEHAVLVIAEPEGGIPFVNVTYAGFIGSVTGMNAQHISIGEMGGGGIGHWQGMPMALLIREALETADELDKAVAVFRDNPRTCQYFYVVADGETNQAVGLEASWNHFMVLQPGQTDPRLPHAVPDAVLMSAGGRYEELVKRTKSKLGQFDANDARELMACPVAMKSNLHNVLFEPRSTRLWVANATPDKKPAADQPYQAFQLSELLKRAPDTSAKELPLVPRGDATAESN